MSLTDLVLPVIKTSFALFFVGIFFWVIYKGTFGRNSNWKYSLKYGLFKKSLPDEIVKRCLTALNEGKTNTEFAKHEMMTQGYSPVQIEEMIYIYNQVKKSTGGGKL